ncbi:hypothetical protein EV138_0018 [Kribbella voronezhensis]|uniref:Uncharacterized protein n=1 Tax=Kribbella voronezhensis TaxID=2512212 RepID=A0A4R7T4U6_9ACTN|nr:hypothetical protein [Kribbella voronezhensis]TDU86509.1 hypothetical protein EV138_0018 [Kribbella voronezhensis]
MTTPAIRAAAPADRAHAALGTALGVVAPEALLLQDGGVRLTGDRDVLGADAMGRLVERLTARAADQASDDRILAEATALLGAEITRARGGRFPADGSTAALDALLDVPDLGAGSRQEAEILLRGVLEGSADTSDSAAARLAELTARERRPLPADVVDAAWDIHREAQVLQRTQPSAVRRTGSGRHRNTVGRRRVALVTAPEQRKTGLVAGGRPAAQADLTDDAVLRALAQVQPADFAGSVTAPPTALDVPRVAVFETAAHGKQHVRVEIADPGYGRVAAADVRSGSADNPHVLRVGARVDDAQLARIWVNQFSRIQQQVGVDRPRGFADRLRALVNHEGRDRRLAGQYDEFRLLTRNWREARGQVASTGQVSGPQSVEELERDLRGLAATIGRRGGTPPALPWTSGATVVPVVASAGMTTPAVTAAPNTPAHLRERVTVEIATLDRSIDDLTGRVAAKEESAAAARKEGGKKRDDAGEESAKNDQGAPERARKLLVEASAADGKARRHTEQAAVLRSALGEATEARAAYVALGNELDAVVADPRKSIADVLPLSQAAAEQTEAFQRSLAKAAPRRDVLHSGAPTGRLPHLTALTAHLNQVLEANNLPHRFTTEMLHRTLRAEFRRVMSPDGLVLPLGGDPSDDVRELAQVRLKLQPGELAEVMDPEVKLAELMVGQLEQGGHGVSATATGTFGRTGGFSLKTLMAMMPATDPVTAAAKVVAPGYEFAFGRSRSVTTAATEYALGGAVEDNRGESQLFEGAAGWEVEVRTSAVGPWSAAGRVDTSGPRDSGSLKVWVSAAYVVDPPKDTTTIAELGEARDPALPEHVATDVRGLGDLVDKTIRGTRERLNVLDRVAHDQIRNLLTEELPSRLDEATKPGGIGRLIYSGGEPVAYAQVETEVVWEKAELVGETSTDHWQERLRVGFSGATGNEGFAANSSSSLTLGYAGDALSDLGSTNVDFGPTVKAGRSTSRSDSMSAGGTAIHPSVQRYTGPTQGYRMTLKHKVTVHQIGGKGKFTEKGEGTALLRFPEKDAFRYGLPVDKAAVVREPDGKPRKDKKERILLRGDPQPTEEELQLPDWIGDEPGRMRGAGPALVQHVTGADKALDATARALSRQGLLPPLDAKGRPRLDALPKDPLLRASQLQNYERLHQHLSALRLETGYDQAAQSGLPLALVEHRAGHAPQYRTFRIGLQQNFGKATCLGVTDAEAVVNLDIASRTSGRSGGRSKRLPWGITFGFSDNPATGHAGQTPQGGPSYGRASLGRFMNWATGGTVNQVALVESTAPVAVFDVPHKLVLTEVTAAGDSEPLAEVDGSASVLLDSELLNQKDVPAATPFQGRTSEAVLDQAKLLHLDIRDPLKRIQAALPAASRPDGPGYHHLAAFLNARNLIAHPEWKTTEYRTRIGLSPAPSSLPQAIAQQGLRPRRATVSLTAKVENHTFLRATHQVSGDINLTLGSYSTTDGSSTGNNAGVSGGSGMAGADGSAVGGSAGWSRSGSESRSRSETQIWGWERLRIEIGQHYVFKADVNFTAKVADGESAEPQQIKLDDGTVLFTLPERDALRLYGRRELDLPLHQVADAAERFLKGDLTMDRRTASAFVRRYESEKSGVTDGLAATHTRAQLATKVRELAGMGSAAAGTPQAELENTLDTADELVAKTTEVSLPEHYNSMMGAALIEKTEFTNEAGTSLDVHAAVKSAVEQAAPGRFEKDPILSESLYGDLAGKRWQGHLDDMLDPRGFVKEYPVKTSGTGPPEVLRLRVRAVFAGPVVGDGTEESAISIVQGYDYEEFSRSRSHSTSHSFNVGGAGNEALGGNVGVSTDQSRTSSASSGEQSTMLQRMLHGKTSRVERQMHLLVEVERLPVAGGSTKGILRRNADRAVSEDRGGYGAELLSGGMTQLVPTAVLNSPPTPKSTPERQDHREVVLPASYFVEGTRPYLQGEPETDKLFDTIAERLAARDMLSVNGVRMHRTELENQLSASVRSAAFHRMASDEGHRMVRLPVPGHGNQVVDVRVAARVSDVQLVGNPIEDGQLGVIDRIQRTAKTSATANQWVPASGAGGGGAGALGVSAGVSVGEQASYTDSDTTGNRNELSKYEKGTLVTVRVRVDYDLTFERSKLTRGGDEKVKKSDSMSQVATGEAYLTMFEQQYLEMRERMETGASLSEALEGLDPQVAGRHQFAFDHTENEAGQPEYHPYQPMLDALAEARKDGTTVQLTIQQQDGQVRTYQAKPDGTMRGLNDGGFGAAFATLHPRLAQLAEGRVDLQQLFNTAERTKHFSGAVSEALQKKGIPAAALTELDHSLAARAAASRTAGDGARRQTQAAPAAHGVEISS